MEKAAHQISDQLQVATRGLALLGERWLRSRILEVLPLFRPGLSAIAFQLGRCENGWKVARHPRIKPVPRMEIWATILPPLAFWARIA